MSKIAEDPKLAFPECAKWLTEELNLCITQDSRLQAVKVVKQFLEVLV